MGLKKGDHVALISNNRPEWNFIDMACSKSGIVLVPVYPTISEDEYSYIIGHCEPKFVFVSDKQLYNKLNPIVEKSRKVKKLFTLNEVDGAANWRQVLHTGIESFDKNIPKLQEVKNYVSPDDIVTLIYTSGTTGVSKGVMLTHLNLMSNVISTSKAHPYGYKDKALSFLPLSHVYERMMNYNFQYKAISIYYAENMGTIVDNLQEIQPRIFNSVPRVIELVYDKLIAKGKELSPLSRLIFFRAVKLAEKFKVEGNSIFFRIKQKLYDKLIYKKWRAALGNVATVVSGGASLSVSKAKIFWTAGICIYEGYGLTETSPVIAVNLVKPGGYKLGSVGTILEGVEAKLTNEGEIICRGPNVMRGYYKAKDLTDEVIDSDGWFHTGDIGEFDKDGFLRISDRKKEIFKLSNGKYIAPQMIENKLKESFFIEQPMVIGEGEKFASAIISPNFDYLHKFASDNNISFQDNQKLIENSAVVKVFQREINNINKGLGTNDQIKRFRLVADQWTTNTGELSPTLKLKRRKIFERYKDLIEEIYSVGKTDDQQNGLRKVLRGFRRRSKNIAAAFKLPNLYGGGGNDVSNNRSPE
jgi:long-chain acyl-CoA synthetase